MTGSSITRQINGEKFGRWSLRPDAAYPPTRRLTSGFIIGLYLARVG